jgi:hypothetical protein
MRGLAAQLSAALLVAGTPWIVASIARRVATTHAGAPAPHVPSMKPLGAMTVGAAIATSIATVTLAPSLWMLLIVGLGFGGAAAVALRVLGEIDDLTRPARQVSSAERAASLRPRKPGEYVAWSWRLAAAGTAVLGAAAFVVRASSAGSDRPMFVPIMFAAAALIFLWLYEVWMHQVITGPIVAGDAGNLRRFVRRIFAMELLLVVACLGTAHTLLNFDWAANGTLGAAIALAGGVVAIAGCALAVASGLVGRRYETVGRYEP